MIVRSVVVATTIAVLSAPTAARADDWPTVCVPAPADTIGVHVEVGDKEVHVPAISDARLCVTVFPPVGEASPVQLTLVPGCGSPCFVLVVEEGGWMVASTRIQAYLSYASDGVPVVVPLADVPVSVSVYNSTPICVAAGNPIPECPPNTLTIPVPLP